MKKFAIVFLGVVAALLLGAVTLQAQIPKAIQTWDFETTLGSWMSGGEKSAISLSAEQAAGGTQSIKLVKPATGLEINLQNDAYKDLKKGDQVSFKIWMSAADQAMVNGVQLFWQTGAGWSWNSIWINGSDITGDAWTTITREMANDVATPLQRIGVQVLLKAGNEAATPAVYIDDFTIIRMVDITIVKDWGKTPQGTAWPILNTAATPDGDAGMGNNAIPTGWATIRGQFSETMEATTEQAVVVYGQLEFVGGGGASNYTHLRYALTYQDSATLKNQKTDSAAWVSTKKHFGYGFHPRTGTGTMSNGNGGAGVVWTIKDGSWSSTWSNNGLPISAAKQAPRDAVMEAGIYNFAISVQPLPDGNNEVRWYMVEQKNKYWYGGTTIDTAQVTTKFNGICFGFNKDTEATQVNFYAVEVDMGEPITIPEAPWEAYYVDSWGFYGGRLGGWKFIRGEFDGDATASGDAPNTGWSALRGGFDAIAPTPEKALSITGKIELVGGGFEAVRSLRFALAYSDSAGKVDTTSVDSTKWTGTDAHDFAYLFLPTSGANGPVDWQGIGAKGTLGAVVDNPWLSTSGANNYVLGSVLQRPDQAVGGAGTYEFGISVQPLGNGTSEIRVKLLKTDGTYAWAVKTTDMHSPLVTDKFNSILFALNTNASTTAMNLMEVLVDKGAPIELPDWVVSVEAPEQTAALPTVYALGQNYPNPFNPTTTMEVSLPKNSQVSLVVYDALGKVVAELMNGTYNAGVHKVNFNAINLSSGIYFYKLTAGEFTSTRKLMLLK